MAKSKGKRKGKKKGKKKKKDMTWDRTMESLFEELVQQRIIKNYPKVRMDSLVSQSSFINDELRSYHTAHPMEKKLTEWFMPGDANPHPAFGDVLRTVKDVCILPMGSVEVHKQTPFQTKSCLICGPRGSGKRTLLNVICTELKATLMDLTATNISGRYPGKAGLKMLMHLIQKVGRYVQPVIILIDNCEKTFQRKVPKDDLTEPKRLKKQLGKLMKGFTPNDLFLLVGLTSEPWQCSLKPLKKTYQRMIYIPPADYGTRFEVWKRGLVSSQEMLHTDINYSLLTKLTQGWTAGNIRRACSDVIQKHKRDVAKQERAKQKDMDPWAHLGNLVTRATTIGKLYITMDTLLEAISEYDPVFLEQEKLWNKWFNKTTLQKARLATQVGTGGKKKKKGKKGKGKK